MMVLFNYIIFGWSIRGVTKIELIGTSLYEVTKSNTTQVDMCRRLVGCFRVTKNGGHVCFWWFILNNLYLLRQPIPQFPRYYLENISLQRGVLLNHINIGVYVKLSLIPTIGQLFKLIYTPKGFIPKNNVLLEFFSWFVASERRSSEYFS